jgi:hypothetical protein
MKRLALVLLVACTPRLPPQATSADAERANVALGELATGRTMLIKKCGGCHRPPSPSAHTAVEWPRSLDEMSTRSNLDGEQRRLIQLYLVSLAR